MIAKLETTQSTAKQNKDLILNLHKNGSNNIERKQQQNHRLRTDSNRSHWEA